MANVSQLQHLLDILVRYPGVSFYKRNQLVYVYEMFDDGYMQFAQKYLCSGLQLLHEMNLLQGKDLDQHIQACLQKVSGMIWTNSTSPLKAAYDEYIKKQAEESRTGMKYNYSCLDSESSQIYNNLYAFSLIKRKLET